MTRDEIQSKPISAEYMDIEDEGEPLMSGWIAPNGDWYPTIAGEHMTTAARIIKQHGLENLNGWIMLQYGMFEPIFVRSAQHDTLRKLLCLLPNCEQRDLMIDSIARIEV